ALKSMGLDRLGDIEGVLANQELREALYKKFSPEVADASEDQKLARQVSLMRLKTELQAVVDATGGKRLPPAKLRVDFLSRSTTRYGGGLSNNLLVDPPMLAAIMLDPCVYRTLRVPSDQANAEDSTETTRGGHRTGSTRSGPYRSGWS
ncbi:hypothetical protein FOL47_001678, partial [Perkinsus chesapeaki]